MQGRMSKLRGSDYVIDCSSSGIISQTLPCMKFCRFPHHVFTTLDEHLSPIEA